MAAASSETVSRALGRRTRRSGGMTEWCRSILRELDLDRFADERAGNLPYGTLKRVEIARALAAQAAAAAARRARRRPQPRRTDRVRQPDHAHPRRVRAHRAAGRASDGPGDGPVRPPAGAASRASCWPKERPPRSAPIRPWSPPISGRPHDARCCRCAACMPATARSACCTASISRSRTARSSRCSAPTAPARPRRCARCPA